MKNIKISKKIWRRFCKIKNKEHYTNFSQVIEYILKGEREHEIKKPEGNFDEWLKEIEDHCNSLSKPPIEETFSPLPNEIIFMCLQCGQDFIFKKKDQSEVEGISCQNCGFHHAMQIYAWLPDPQEDDIK